MNAVLTKPLTAQNCIDILDAFIPGYHQPNATPQEVAYRSELPQHNDSLFDLVPYPALDIDAGIKATGTVEVLAQMLHFMVNDSLIPDVQLMKQAHEALDWDKVQQIAHKIKGGAVYVGTVKIKMACQYLERYWKSGQRELLEALYQQTLQVIDESLLDIKRWLHSH